MRYLVAAILFAAVSPALLAKANVFKKQVQPILQQYCYDCHGNGKSKGDLSLDKYKTLESIRNDRKTWELVLRNVKSGEMPPEKKPRPNLLTNDDFGKKLDRIILKSLRKKPAERYASVRDRIGTATARVFSLFDATRVETARALLQQLAETDPATIDAVAFAEAPA